MYKFTEGDGAIFIRGSKDNLAFSTNGAADKYKGIFIDGKEYTLEAGSDEDEFSFELYADFLETLEDGEHEIKITFEDGELKGHFFIEAGEGAASASENADDPANGSAQGSASSENKRSASNVSNVTQAQPNSGAANTSAGVVRNAGTVSTAAVSTGDKNNTVLYAGIAAATGAAAVVAGVVLRRKRSEG